MESKIIEKNDWPRILLAAEAHPNGVSGYCREHGIRAPRLYYWKNKLAERKPRQIERPSFARVEIVKCAEKTQRTPDPKWLADFLRALHGDL